MPDLDDIGTAETQIAAAMMRLLDRHDAEAALEEERLRLEGSLIAFVEEAWPWIDSAEFVDGWHIEALCEHLEAVTRGEIRRFLANYPPRCGKTIVTCVIWPVWCWIQREIRITSGPQVKFLCGSYGQALGLQSSLLCRRLIETVWFQRRWGDRIIITPDMNTKTQFDLVSGGSRMTTSVGGTLIGVGGQICLADDPENTEQVESDTERETALTWWKEFSTTRLNDPQEGAVVLIMQRLHKQDVSGYILDSEDASAWTHLSIPMLYDSSRHCETSIGWSDPREEDGELMDPLRFTPQIVEQMRRNLGPYLFSGRFQQSPTPKEGGIIERSWWRLWPDDAERITGAVFTYRCHSCGWEDRRLNVGALMPCATCDRMAERRLEYPQISFSLLSVDTAYGEKEENSWSAATHWGIWHDENDAPRCMLMEAWRGRPRLRGDPATGRKGLVEIIHELATRPGREADCILIEKKTRGVDLYNELERLTAEWPARLEYFNPGGGRSTGIIGARDKTARLHACVGLFTNERVWAPNKHWADLVIEEVVDQPKAAFNDLADTVAQALLYFRASGLLTLGEEHSRDKRRSLIYRGKQWSASEEFEGR